MFRLLRGFRGLAAATALGMTITGLASAGPATAPALAAVSANWPQFQRNAAHTGYEPGENSINRGNVSQLSLAWTAALPAGEGTANDVVVTGGVVYTSEGSDVRALNAQTGAQLWQVTFPSYVNGSPSVGDGLVLISFSQKHHRHLMGYIDALNATTGATVWTDKLGLHAGVDGPITITSGQAYFLSNTSQVEAIGLSHGYKIWTSPAVPGCSPSPPTVADGYVVVGSGGSDVSAMHASNGTLAWHDTLNNQCGSSTDNWTPAISHGTVYAGLMDGVDAIDVASGSVLWHTPSTSGVFFPVTLTGQYVLASMDNTTELTALNRSTGAQVWQTAFPNSGEIVGTYVFGKLAWFLLQPVTGGSVHITAVNANTGQRVFSSAQYPDQDQGFPPVVDAGHVYTSTGMEVVSYALPAGR